jgi:hypothetical protein
MTYEYVTRDCIWVVLAKALRGSNGTALQCGHVHLGRAT